MSDDRLAQARAEAERRQTAKHWRMWEDEGERLSYPWSMGFLAGFREGAEWADANPYSTPEALVAAYEEGQRDAVSKGVAKARITGAAWADDNPQPADGDTSDGYHTFNELYEYRMLYNAHAAHGWLAQGIPVVKSWRHADGEECFGGGSFIVTASLPAGQVSNHYAARYWGLFKVPEVNVPPEWDGHTPEDAARRLRVEAEHANPRPRTITLAQSEAILEAGRTGRYEDHEAALKAAGIEVDDDE